MMKNWTYLVCVLLSIAAVGGLLWWSPWAQPEPVYDGKPLSFWLTDTTPTPGKGPDYTIARDTNAIPFLVKALKYSLSDRAKNKHTPGQPPEARRRSHAAMVLMLMGPLAEPAIPALIRAWKNDDDSMVTHYAVLALVGIGKADRNVVMALSEALREPDRCRLATNALLRLDPEAAARAGISLPALVGSLAATNPDSVRTAAAFALCGLKQGNTSLVAAWTEALSDEDEYVRRQATNALLSLGSDAAKKAGISIPLLLGRLADANHWMFRTDAAWALGQIGEGDKAAVAALAEALRDTNIVVQFTAASALARIGCVDSNAITALTEALKDKDATVRENAADALLKLNLKVADKAGVKAVPP
jgi:HEAT repeat protein